jgi:uncharacterized protein YndB with AHSA1/START domain
MIIDSANTEPAAAESEFGERIGSDTLRFVRRFIAPSADVWNAIATADGLAGWLGRPVALDVRAGGAFAVVLVEDDVMDGRVIACEPGRYLEIDWHESSDGRSLPYGTQAGHRSRITFELVPAEGGGTQLIFTHRYIHGGDIMVGFGAGWHAFLDALGALLGAAPAADGPTRYAELEPHYRARLTG